MGNYENLKQSITEVIRTNGNQEITGAVLQSTLLTIISSVGANATFAGIATPTTNPGTPDGPVFYLASESGTYTNFNAIELQDGLSVLLWNGSWSSQQMFSIDDVPTAGSDNLVKSGGIAKMDTVGVKKVVEEKTSIIIPYPFKAGKKYVLAYTGNISAAYTSNSSSWEQGRVEEVTGIIGTNKSTVFIPIADADYMTFWSTTKDNEFTISVPTTETERIENNINNEFPIKLNQYIHIGGYLNGTWNNLSNTTMVRSKELIPIIGAGIKRWFVENYTLAEGHTLFHTFITYDKDGNVVRNITKNKTSSLYFNSDEVYIGFCIGEWDENGDDADLQHTLNLSESYKLGVEFISYNEVLNIDNAFCIYFSDRKQPIFSLEDSVISVQFPVGFFRIYNSGFTNTLGNITCNNELYQVQDLQRLVLDSKTKQISVIGANDNKQYINLLVNHGESISGLLAPYFIKYRDGAYTAAIAEIDSLTSSPVTINFSDDWGDVHPYRFRKGKQYTLTFSRNMSFWTLRVGAHDTTMRVDNITDMVANTPLIFTPTEDADYCEGYYSGTVTIKPVDAIQDKLKEHDNDIESINEQFLPSTTVTINLEEGWDDVHYYPFRKGKHYTLIFSKTQSSFWTLTSSTHDTSKRVDNITNIAAGSHITFIPTEDADYCEGWNEGVLTIQNETIKNDIDVIQGKLDLTDIINLYPTVDYLPKVATLKKKTPYGWSTKNTPYCFLWFSDIHGDVNNYNRINKWYNHYKNYIDDIINCGDTVEDNISGSGINRFDSMVAINNKVLTALGNHDVCANVVNYKGYDGATTIPNIYNMFTKKLGIAELGIVQPTNAEANGYNFYYKDYPDGAVTCKPLRVVVLDSCISPAAITESGTGNDTTAATAYVAAQLSWFEQVLADAKTNDYAVVACAHGIRPCTELSSNTAFTKYGALELLFDNASYLTADFVTAVNTFKQGGGEFVCWLSGHVHADHIAKVTAYPDQLVIAVNTATSRSSDSSGTNPHRTAYNTNSGITKTTDAFDMVEIDTYYKVVRLVAVGTNYDMFGRHKDMIAINYDTCSILM